MTIRRAGDRALLLDVGDLAAAHRVHAGLRAAALPGIVDIVPGARTVLVVADPERVDLRWLAAELPERSFPDTEAGAAGALDVPVVYDGEDLETVASHTGMTVEEVIRCHTRAVHTVAFLGFAPGFGYISGAEALHVPRRGSPRAAVPAGAVALADGYSGIYPRSTPGGWQLIGRTEMVTWDTDRQPPALLHPGRRVRFHAVAG